MKIAMIWAKRNTISGQEAVEIHVEELGSRARWKQASRWMSIAVNMYCKNRVKYHRGIHFDLLHSTFSTERTSESPFYLLRFSWQL